MSIAADNARVADRDLRAYEHGLGLTDQEWDEAEDRIREYAPAAHMCDTPIRPAEVDHFLQRKWAGAADTAQPTTRKEAS